MVACNRLSLYLPLSFSSSSYFVSFSIQKWTWCVFNLQEVFFSPSLIVERWRAEHQLQFPMSLAPTVVHYTCTIAIIRQTGGGHKTVTKGNNRRHRTRTAKTLGVEPFFCGVNKGKEHWSEGIACRWQPQSVSPYKALCSIVRCSDSHMHRYCHQSDKIKYLALTLSVAWFFKFFEHRDRL